MQVIGVCWDENETRRCWEGRLFNLQNPGRRARERDWPRHTLQVAAQTEPGASIHCPDHRGTCQKGSDTLTSLDASYSKARLPSAGLLASQ